VTIHDLKDADGRVFAFEVDNFHLGRRGVCRVVSQIPGCVIVREPKRFRWSFEDDEEFCEFDLEGVRFVVWEPWGDNSRYWVGPKSDSQRAPVWCPQIDAVREEFRRVRPFLGVILNLRKAGTSEEQPKR
jgi:hypothetical protein